MTKNKQIKNKIETSDLESVETGLERFNDLEANENEVSSSQVNSDIVNSKEILSNWSADIKKDSIKKALEAGVIFPNFKPYKNTVYKVKIISQPREVIHNDNKFFVIDIEKDGMKFSMNMNNSFRFQLALILERYKLTIAELIGKHILITKDDIGYFNLQYSM